MAGLYVDDYRPWPSWVVNSFDDLDRVSHLQVGTYRGHADRDPGHDMSGNLAADLWLFNNTDANHNKILAWFKANAKRIGATYIITNSRIWSVARADEGVRKYSGPDPHQDHIHISYGTTPPKEEDDMPWTEAELKTVIREVILSDTVLTAIAKKVVTLDGVIENPYPDKTTNSHVSLETMVERIARDAGKLT